MSNQIVNPEFTSDVSGWAVANASDAWQDLSIVPGPTGGVNNFGAKLTSTLANTSSLAQSISGLTPGKWFVGRVRAYSPSSNVGSRCAVFRLETDSFSLIKSRQIYTLPQQFIDLLKRSIWVDFDSTSFTPPTALVTSTVGRVKKMAIMPGTPPGHGWRQGRSMASNRH